MDGCHGGKDGWGRTERISDIEDKHMENNEAEKKREVKAKEHDLRMTEISDSLRKEQHQNLRGPRRGRERNRGKRVM